MKKKDLKLLIQECVKTFVNESFITENIKDPTREEMVYDSLESEYGSGEQKNQEDELQEDGAGAASGMGGVGAVGSPGTGAGNVTANVDPIRTPKAFKHPKNLPAHVKENEEEDPLYVEYIGQMRDEKPFMLGGQKYEYVMAKYPNGKKDIGVYAFSGDVVYSYNAFRQMHNIK